MNEMIITNAEFGSIRIEMRNGEPWFVGSSIAKVLKYQNQQKAIRDHVDAEDKLTEQIVLAGQRREVTLINESGLYSLILSSKEIQALDNVGGSPGDPENRRVSADSTAGQRVTCSGSPRSAENH